MTAWALSAGTRRTTSVATYADGVALLGENGMIRLCAVIGYYCSISMILNLFEIDLPAGEEPIWRR